MNRLVPLVLPLVFLTDAALAQTARPPAAPADSMRSLVTREFELHAPTDEALRSVGDDLRVAVTQFAHYMGQNPKKMAFLLFRSAAERDRYDFTPFTRRRIPVVGLIIPAKPAGSPPGAAPGGKPGSEAEPISHEAGHRFFVDYTEHALATARGGERSAPPDAGAAPGAGGDTPAGTAGHPTHKTMPDWLEEAVAALCERPAYQNRRIEFMRSRLSRRIPFAELLTMPIPPEPAAAAGGGNAKNAGAAKAGGGPSARAERAAIFRAEALSLARFIAHREDARFIGTIAEGVIAGRTVGEVLNTSQHLFSKPDALEKQWLEWMESANGAAGQAKE